MVYHSYAKLREEEDEPDFRLSYRDRFQLSTARCSPLWIIATLFFSSLSFIQLLTSYYPKLGRGYELYEQGFSTDLSTTRLAIELEERLFTGWISYNHTSRDVYRVTDPTEPQYFGPPSADIDNAWNDLLYGQYPALTEEESTAFFTGYPVADSKDFSSNESHKLFRGLYRDHTTHNYHMQLDVFHSLHCLNYVRKSLSPAYYNEHPTHVTDPKIRVPPSWPQVHLDHCLDHLRQSIQCHGDLSPAPFYAWKGFDLTVATGQRHVCRNFALIKEWQDKRNREMTFMEAPD